MRTTYWNFKNYKSQKCLNCGRFMKLESDYIMGGSHYYNYKCITCDQKFHGSTYDFIIRKAEPRSDKPYDNFIDIIKHHF